MKKIHIYQLGYFLSILCTLGAFGIVDEHIVSGHVLFDHLSILIIIIFLALIQFAIQAVTFLHLSRKSPSSNLTVFSLALLVVFILVGGSLWIMSNLQNNMPIPFTDQIVSPQAEQD